MKNATMPITEHSVGKLYREIVWEFFRTGQFTTQNIFDWRNVRNVRRDCSPARAAFTILTVPTHIRALFREDFTRKLYCLLI